MRNGRGTFSALLAGTLLLSPASARAERIHPKAGSSSAAFLKIGAGARPIGMGEAFTAVAHDVHSLYWNPAGLAGRVSRDVGYTFEDHFQDLRHDFVGYARPWERIGMGGAWGASVTSLRVPDDLERRSGSSENDPFNPISSSEGSFGASDLALSVSAARFLRAGHAAGASLKFIRQSIDAESAHTFGVDLGWQWRDAFPGLSLGAVLQNIGPGVKFGRRFPLPFTWKLGAAYEVPRLRSRGVLDLIKARDDFPVAAFGAEADVLPMLSVRAGYRYRLYGNPLGGFSGIRTGGGFRYGRFSLDYAFAPFGELGKTHRITFGWRFGGLLDVEASARRRRAEERQRVEEEAAARIPPAPLPPARPVLPEGAYTGFSVSPVRVRGLSARGGLFEIRAAAPSEEWGLRRIELRGRGSSAKGITIGVLRSEAPVKLPDGSKASEVFKLRVHPRPEVRSARFTLRLHDKDARVFGMFEGRWEQLKVRFGTAEGASPSASIRCAGLPEALAVSARVPELKADEASLSISPVITPPDGEETPEASRNKVSDVPAPPVAEEPVGGIFVPRFED